MVKYRLLLLIIGLTGLGRGMLMTPSLIPPLSTAIQRLGGIKKNEIRGARERTPQEVLLLQHKLYREVTAEKE